MNIWDTAVEDVKKKEAEKGINDEPTLLFVGSIKAGKTSLIYRFLNRDESPKPTLALDYTFARQSRSNTLSKDVCHIWELGGGTLFKDLLDIVIVADNIESLTVVIVVDLSCPEELLVVLLDILKLLRLRLDHIYGENKSQQDVLIKKQWSAVGDDHPDFGKIKMFPFPLVILGGKYDLFQNFEPEQKKIICRTLRYFAHTNGVSLQFFSSKIENLINKSRALLSNLIFGTPTLPNVAHDYNKPLVIPVGSDFLQQIEMGGSEGKSSDSLWKNIYEKSFPQVTARYTMPADPGNDPTFREIEIDNLRAQKDEELQRYRRSKQLDGHK